MMPLFAEAAGKAIAAFAKAIGEAAPVIIGALVKLIGALLDGIKASKVLTKEKLVGGVILLTAFEDKKYIEMAKEVGAFGYMIKPVNEKVFIPTVEMCLSKAEEFDELKKDYDKINNKLNDRKLIEKAKGILVKQLNSNENDAYNRIRKLSMDRRTTMAEIAKIIIVGYEG